MKDNSIDTEVWITQLALANELRVSIQVVHNWVRRGKLETVKLPGSRIRLVNRLQGISLKHYWKTKKKVKVITLSIIYQNVKAKVNVLQNVGISLFYDVMIVIGLFFCWNITPCLPMDINPIPYENNFKEQLFKSKNY